MNNRIKLAQNISSVAFTSLCFIGVLVCIICDRAIFGVLTWSLIAVSSIVFGWLVLIPVVRLWEKGIWWSLAALSVFIFPYIGMLDRLIPETILFSVAVWAAPAGIVYLWTVYGLFTLLNRKWLAAGITAVLAFPVMLLLNWVLTGLLGTAFLDSWDWLTFLTIGAAAVVFFGLDFRSWKKRRP